MKRIIMCVSVFFALAGMASALDWEDCYQTTLDKAHEKQKYIFMLFTGSDWCPYCKVLAKDVLPKPEFVSYAEKNLICLELDFPRKKQQPPALRLQNEMLNNFYKIEGFPTIIVLRPDGSYLATLMYRGDNAASFTERLKETVEKDPRKPVSPVEKTKKASSKKVK